LIPIEKVNQELLSIVSNSWMSEKESIKDLIQIMQAFTNFKQIQVKHIQVRLLDYIQ
jgi:hypothetical protein